VGPKPPAFPPPPWLIVKGKGKTSEQEQEKEEQEEEATPLPSAASLLGVLAELTTRAAAVSTRTRASVQGMPPRQALRSPTRSPKSSGQDKGFASKGKGKNKDKSKGTNKAAKRGKT
jgi:hypothetical protein